MNNMSAEVLRMTSGQLFFYLIGFIPFLICFPIWTVARFVWTPWSKEIMEEIQEKVPFSDMYPYSEDYKDDYETNYENNVVIEDTPNGTVIMKYNGDEKAFHYWSNKSVLQDVLNTCARKYVKVFHCSEIYYHEPEKKEDEEEQTDTDVETKTVVLDETIEDKVKEDEKEEEEESDDDGVFVKFKAQKAKEAKAGVEKKEEKIINKFLKKGSINDYMMIPEKARNFTRELTSEKKMSWSDWLSKSKVE
tara:strand:- start:3692 stop:4435 length:744 start_codon:yes stop_codon:yes gene_type:complete